MSAVYLIRHAQAGPRHKYDELSPLGEMQARRLGEYLARTQTRFDAVYSGGLARQLRTAGMVRECVRQNGEPFPEIQIEPCWDEFDLGAVYRAMSARLRQDDTEFRREFDAMIAVLEDESHEIHRNHSYCDIAVVRAWVEQRYDYGGESWRAFRERVLNPRDDLVRHGSGRKVAVFTSATPVSVWVAHSLRLDDENLWRLAGIVYNTGITTLRVAPGDVRLFTFNATPHLSDEPMRTFR